MNPTGGVIWRRDIVLPDPGDPLQFVKELQVWSLAARLRRGRLREPPGEPVPSKSKETRMPGGVGAGGEKPPTTRLARGYGVNISCKIAKIRASVDEESFPTRRIRRSRSPTSSTT